MQRNKRYLPFTPQLEQLLQAPVLLMGRFGKVAAISCSEGNGLKYMKANHPKTILLVDDDGSVREVIKMALEAWGYGVSVAEDGEQALSMIRIKGPNLVLSDVIMPKIDGLSLLRLLKRWNPEIKVILFTAHPTLADAVSAMKEGASDVLTKPIDFRRLRHELERLFGGDDHSSGDGSLSISNPANSGSAARMPSPPKEARFAPAE
jgi:DNA-binding NtrC family response regulator